MKGTVDVFQEAAARLSGYRGATGGGTTSWQPTRAASLLILVAGLFVTAAANVPAALAIGVRLSGRVTDPRGQPVPLTDLDFYYTGTREKIDPTPRGVPPRSDKTDIDGVFDMIVREDSYDIRFEPPAGRDDLATIIVEHVEMAADSTFDVVLPTGHAITGLLTDGTGAPAPFVSVQVTDEVSGVRMPTPGNQSGVDGRYRVVVQPGRYSVTFSPADGSRLVPVTLRGVLLDGPRQIDATLASGFYLEGFVLDDQEQPVGGVDIDVDLLPDEERLRTRNDQTDAAGFYRILVPGGRLDVTWNPPFGAPLAAETRSSVTVAADAALPTIRLARGTRVTGVITDPSGAPLAGARARFTRLSDGAHVPAPWALSDADGRLDFHVASDLHVVQIVPPAGVALDTLVVGTVDLRTDLDVSWGWTGAQLRALVIHLRAAGGDLPVPGRVSAWPTPRTGAPILDEAADPFGDVRLQLAGGSYDIVVRGAPGFTPDSLVFVAVRLDSDLEFTAAFDDENTGTQRALVIEAPAPNPFRGSVYLEASGPVGAPILVQVFDARGRRIRRIANAPLPGGGVTWDGLTDDGTSAPAGHYFIRFELSDGYRQTRRVVRLPR